MFYKLQNLLTRYATRPRWREEIIRTLQGNPYLPETQARAREAPGCHADVLREGHRATPGTSCVRG